MDNQHRKIKGYRELSEQEIDLMNEVKDLAIKVGVVVDKLMKADFCTNSDQVPDARWVAAGKTQLQMGFMALNRSIAKPETF